MARYDLTDFEWRVIKPLLPNKPRGVPRVEDRRVLDGIFWILRSGSPWRDLPERYGPYATAYNRFNRRRKAGVWDSSWTQSSRSTRATMPTGSGTSSSAAATSSSSFATSPCV